MNAPQISSPLLWFFRGIVRSYLRRHFHGVRISGTERFTDGRNGAGPLIVYANHGSWWDPMVAYFLADRLMPQRQHFAPMDATSLERYRLLKRLGVFPVEMGTPRGAIQFLRVGEAILKRGGVLWVTPQGAFADARVRPLVFKPGLAALAIRVTRDLGSCRVLPLAIEYCFWEERLPECLLRFGDAVQVTANEEADHLEARLIAALTEPMEQLKQMAIRRDASLFESLATGAAGVGGFYAVGKRIREVLLPRTNQPQSSGLTIARKRVR
jgi:1-acyl-sn-glycerol-3-phosphate acyltransferase